MLDVSKLVDAYFQMECAKESVDKFNFLGHYQLQEMAKDFVKRLAEQYASSRVCLNMTWDSLENRVDVDLEGDDVPPIVLNRYKKLFEYWGINFMNNKYNEVYAYYRAR